MKERIACKNDLEALRSNIPPEYQQCFQELFSDLTKQEILYFIRELLAKAQEREVTKEEVEQLRENTKALNLSQFCKCCSVE